MAQLKAFKGLRPKSDSAEKIAELPYDVVSTEEAKQIAQGNPVSFFHITRPEIDLSPSVDPYSEEVYQKGKDSLDKLIQSGDLIQDTSECLYLYTLIMDGRSQTGVVTCVSIDDYLNNIIKKHELTREDKERDRTRHLEILNANTGPVFMLYKNDDKKKSILADAATCEVLYDFTTNDGIRHIIKRIDSTDIIKEIKTAFSDSFLYIADGHHRAASAVSAGLKKRDQHPDYNGSEEFNWFLAVMFPDDELKILAYNRVVKNEVIPDDSFIAKLEEHFTVELTDKTEPDAMHTIMMYKAGQWNKLTPMFQIPGDPIGQLDVQILQETVLQAILQIQDIRTDSRVNFIGGIRGTAELEKVVDNGNYDIAFSMYPTSISQLIEVSDSDNIMPPKSTWFEPKLRSGLLIHLL